MDHQQFSALVERRFRLTRDVLASKGKEYGPVDKLHNFKRAAEIGRCTSEQALLGMLTKHIVSIIDQIKSGDTPTQEWIDEKIGDGINYLILLEGLWDEELWNQQVDAAYVD